MDSKKKKMEFKNVKIIVIVAIILLICWFLIISPFIKFKRMENQVTDAAKRYFEINNSLLPTGKKIRTVTLQKLYEKGLIENDLKSPYFSKMCDSKASWAKVKKENNEYKYYVYLKCGVLSSKIDHNGPEINLNGNDVVTLNKGDKYKDAGVKSVVDDTDGNLNPKDVTIDTSKVNTNKIGTYEVTYKIRDSFNNQTIKVRTVKVEQILNEIVKKDTNNLGIYKGSNGSKVVQIDGIIFSIVGINEDGSVKLVANNEILYSDYNSIDDILDDFYNNLSDKAKEYIEEKSKWCNEDVSDPKDYNKCNKYGKKSPVGLLSIEDINNSYDDNDTSWLAYADSNYWLSNGNKKQEYMLSNTMGINLYSKKDIMGVKPVINIKKDSQIISGDGSASSPYLLYKIKSKTGTKLSDLKLGEYINYAGYNWRISNKGSDTFVKVIMDGVVGNNENGIYRTEYSIKNQNYNPGSKGNIAYKINNEVTSYISANKFKKNNIEIIDYKDNVSYKDKTNSKKVGLKLSLVSLFDYFSGDTDDNNSEHWFREHTKSNGKSYYKVSNFGVEKVKYKETEKAVKLVGYLDGNNEVVLGDGTIDKPYKISKK